MTKISVIVPAYNAGRSIERCLRSALEQDFDSFEVVAVDDGSVDSTSSVIARLAEGDPRLKHLRQANGGQSAARAAGVRAATGEWIYFLDSDDEIMPDALSSMYAHAGSGIDAVVFESRLRGRMTRVDFCCELLRFQSWQLWGKLWRRALFDKWAMSVPRFFTTGEDFITQLRLLANMEADVVCLPERKYMYQENSPTSISRAARPDYAYEKSMILEVERCVERIGGDAGTALRHWQLVYLAGMMGLGYRIDCHDSWIERVRAWSEGAELSRRERLAIKAIDAPLLRLPFVFEKQAKRVARRIIDKLKPCSRP